MLKKVAQAQLVLPLLEVLEAAPRGLTAAAAVEAVADRLGLDGEQRRRRAVMPDGSQTNALARDVRWARQKAKLAGLIDGSVRNLWSLTPKGKKDLQFAAPGIVVRIFETANGVALWGEAESAWGYVEDKSLSLILTSPPYPLEGKAKHYGGRTRNDYLDWMTGLCREFHRSLADDGSLVLNLGDVWVPGQPTMSLYQERLLLKLVDELGFHLAQRCVWHNPAKLPAPAQFVTVERVRLNPAVESIWWLSKGPRPKADNRRCLKPYSEAMRRKLAAGGERGAERPSGHVLAPAAFSVDHGGSIQHSLIQAANTSSNDAYQRYCKQHSLPVHPARMPVGIPEVFIPLTTDPEDTVADPFGGSLVVPMVAEQMNRRWLAADRSLTYLRGGFGRFLDAELLVDAA